MIIIAQPYGGLGDNLQYSTIPEAAHSLGIDVYVSNDNKYRNQDIKKLVWECNPYIKGFVDAPGNIDPRNRGGIGVIPQAEERILGKIFNSRPKLYYVPKKIEELSSKVVVDLKARHGNSDTAVDAIKANYPEAVYVNCEGPPTSSSVYSSNIFEWVDIITSAKEFVAQHSGGTLVAAAYNKPCTVYRTTKDHIFMFDLHTYIQV